MQERVTAPETQAFGISIEAPRHQPDHPGGPAEERRTAGVIAA